jgi:gliding motility-associated-like protein
VHGIGSVLTKNRTFITFVRSDDHIIVDNDTFFKKNSGTTMCMFAVEFKHDGTLLYVNHLIEGGYSNSYVGNNFTIDENDNVYFSLKMSNYKLFDSLNSYTIYSGNETNILKFSNKCRTFEWVKKLPICIFPNSLSLDKKGNVFLAGYWEGIPNSFTFASQTISRPQTTTGCVFIFDNKGNDRNWFNVLSSSGESTISGAVANDSNSVYISGFFKGDSAKFDNVWKKSKSNMSYNFIARYTIDGRLIWEKHQDTSADADYYKNNGYGCMMNFNKQFIYVSNFVHDRRVPIVFDGQSYMGTMSNPLYEYWGMNMKLDERGNILWGFRSYFPMSSQGLDKFSNLYFGSSLFEDSVFYGPFKAKGVQGDALIGKTFDYAIFRGEVNYGPYCAGDTFRVPYTKLGEYADTNYFIAELSDENGDFLGRERELGRIQSKDSGTILGQLPLFEVKSSPLYRIRIRSTSPQAQSYYRVDTLKLLIYSKDKAYPGPDTSICKGDTVALNTFGGTKWKWSPNYNMQDSNARETKVWPLITTQYQIIIADSSGCGEADTAFKTVVVRKDLSIKYELPFDTSVCLNSTTPIVVSFHGGDSLSYNWQWVAIDSKGTYYYPKEGKNQIKDTLIYTLPPNEKDSIQFIVFLKDNCMPQTAFSFYTLKVNKEKSKVEFKNRDTAICPGTQLDITSEFADKEAKYYSWKWQLKAANNLWINSTNGNNQKMDTFNYSMPVSQKTKQDIRLVLTDQCSGKNDTAMLSITPRDTLFFSLNTKDTTLCKGQTHIWKVNAKGGYSDAYQYVWLNTETGDTLSLNDSFVCLADSNLKVKLVLFDQCMPKDYSKEFTIDVYPALKIELMNLSDTSFCYSGESNLFSSASGGKGSGYQYKWIVDGTSLGTRDSLLIQNKSLVTENGGTKSVYLVLNDGCTEKQDTGILSLKIEPKINVAIVLNDSICYGKQVILGSVVSGGKGMNRFEWLDENNNTVGSKDTIAYQHLNVIQSKLYRKVRVSNDCPESDSIDVNVTLLAPLNIDILNTDSCVTGNTTLNTVASGGKEHQHKISWYENNSFIGVGNSMTINPSGEIKLYKAVLEDACSVYKDSSEFEVVTAPNIRVNAKGICINDTSKLTVLDLSNVNNLKFKWKIDNAEVENFNGAQLDTVFRELRTYKIKVSTNNQGKCSKSDSINLTIIERPEAKYYFINLNPGAVPIEIEFTDQSLKAQNVRWYYENTYMTDSFKFKRSFNDTGYANIVLVAGRGNSCFDTFSMKVPLFSKFDFYFPTAFSPNNNSINDGFGINEQQKMFVNTYRLRVFNRWGEMVFETEDVNQTWTAEKAQQGVYVYTVDIRDVYYQLHQLKGVVLLLE